MEAKTSHPNRPCYSEAPGETVKLEFDQICFSYTCFFVEAISLFDSHSRQFCQVCPNPPLDPGSASSYHFTDRGLGSIESSDAATIHVPFHTHLIGFLTWLAWPWPSAILTLPFLMLRNVKHVRSLKAGESMSIVDVFGKTSTRQ